MRNAEEKTREGGRGRQRERRRERGEGERERRKEKKREKLKKLKVLRTACAGKFKNNNIKGTIRTT